MDAPTHFYHGLPSIDEVPLDELDEVEDVWAPALPTTDAPTAPPAIVAPSSAPLSMAFCANFM